MRNHHRLLITVLTLLALATAWRLAHGAGTPGKPDPNGPPPPDALQARLPRPVKHVPPEYPRAARDAGIQGTVWVRVGIDRAGRVTTAKVTRSIAALDAAALAAVRQWTFATRLPDGKPAPSNFEVPVRFALHGPDGPPPGMGPPEGGPPHGGPPPPPGSGPPREGPPPPRDGSVAPYPDPRGPDAPPGGHAQIDEMPTVIQRVEPVITPDMKRRKFSGTVVVQTFVSREGRVIEARVSRSVAGLDDAAVAAVRQWRFKPARSGGHPVETWLAVPVRF